MPQVDVRFCPYCGTSLSSLSSTPTPAKPAKPTFAPFAIEPDEEDDRIDRINHLDIRMTSLDVEITKPQAVVGETIGSLYKQGQLQQAKPDDYQRPAPTVNLDPKEVLKEFQKEAGALRSSD